MQELPEGFGAPRSTLGEGFGGSTLGEGFGSIPKSTLGEGFGAVQVTKQPNLNDQQKAVVYAKPRGVKLVIAGAGCGKTSGCILPRAQELYAKIPGEVGIFAFSKDVQLELTERIEKIGGMAAGHIRVWTNHALGLRLVMNNLSLLGLPSNTQLVTKDWEMFKFLGEQVKHQLKQDTLPGYHVDFNTLSEVHFRTLFKAEETARGRGKHPLEVFNEFKALGGFKDKQAMLADFLSWARQCRIKYGKLMFRDLLPLAAQLPVESYEGLNLKHILVDEAQDLNIEQHEVIKKLYLAGAVSLLFVGDPGQAIYKWAGARPDLFLSIPQMYDDVEVFNLETNYRCNQPILDMANSLIENQIGTPIKLKPPGPRPGNPIVALDHPDSLIPWIQTQLASGIDPADICILFRTNAHVLQVEIALSLAGIPYHSKSGSFFEHKAVQDLLSYFQFLYPGRRRTKEQWETIVGHVKFLGKATVESSWDESGNDPLNMGARTPSGARTRNQQKLWWQLVDFCKNVQGMLGDPSLPASHTLNWLLKNRVSEVWDERWADDPDKLDEADLITNALLEWAANFRNAQEFLDAIDNLQAQDPDGITLSTVHKAKGLEWPIVVIFNLGEGTFPLKHSRVDVEEEMCILYVAVTRAQHQLVLVKSKEARLGKSLLHDISEEQNKQVKHLMAMIDTF